MTNEQAISHFKEQLEIFGGEHHEAMKVAIEAIETHIPKRPIEKYADGCLVCPICNGVLEVDYRCPMCGQLIDWED